MMESACQGIEAPDIQASASAPDEMTETKFTCSPHVKKLKNSEINTCEKQQLFFFFFTQQETAILARWQTNEGRQIVPAPPCSFQGAVPAVGTQAEPRGRGSPRRARRLGFTGQSPGESCADR